MSLIKALCVAFSIYSKLPMPHFEWKEEELKYHLIFFPFVGALIGLVECLWYRLYSCVSTRGITFVLIGVAIPLIITGGFHVDGYMDTMDAFRSYKPREDKLEILKDPHIGAFSTIMLALAGLLFGAGYAGIEGRAFIIFSIGFVLSRILSAIAVVTFPKARSDGMLTSFSDSCKGKSHNLVLLVLIIELILVICFCLMIDCVSAFIMIATALVSFYYYYFKTKKELSGITGDTAGYFVTVTEVAIALMLCAKCFLL